MGLLNKLGYRTKHHVWGITGSLIAQLSPIDLLLVMRGSATWKMDDFGSALHILRIGSKSTGNLGFHGTWPPVDVPFNQSSNMWYSPPFWRDFRRTKERKMVFGLLRTITNVSQEAGDVKIPMQFGKSNEINSIYPNDPVGVIIQKYFETKGR